MFLQRHFANSYIHLHKEALVLTYAKQILRRQVLNLPLLENQKHIYAILNSIAEKIETEEMMLEKYLIQKQYLLRQMFI